MSNPLSPSLGKIVAQYGKAMRDGLDQLEKPVANESRKRLIHDYAQTAANVRRERNSAMHKQ